MINLRSLIIGGMTVLAGCQTMATSTDVPARITNPSAASQAALQQAVDDAGFTLRKVQQVRIDGGGMEKGDG